MTIHTHHKIEIVDLIIKQLQHTLLACEKAANDAHLAAVDDQSIAETQYDTLAIESAYLAEGQSKRLLEIKADIMAFNALKQTIASKNTLLEAHIDIGSLVEVSQSLSHNEECSYWYFIGPNAGGNKVTFLSHEIIIVTLASPLGKALKGKIIDDDYEFRIGNAVQQGVIESIV